MRTNILTNSFERFRTGGRVNVDRSTGEAKSRRDLLKTSSVMLLTSGLASTSMAHSDPNGKSAQMASGDAQFANHAPSTGWLPFQMPDHRHLVIQAQLNGVSTEAVLDSGVGITVLDINFAAKLGLGRRAEFHGMGLTGFASGSVAEGILIRIGDLSVRTQTTSLFDMTALGAAAGRPLLAIIGRDIFGATIVDIDFAKRRIAFRGHADDSDANATVLSLKPTADKVREFPFR